MQTPILRSLLFIPGNQPRMLEKAFGLPADAIVPDMEDSIAEADKAQARETIAAHLPRLRSLPGWLLPRVNALGTPWFEQDLQAVIGPQIDGICIGKVGSASDISEISRQMAELERRAGMAVGSVRLLPWIETAAAIVNCSEICHASQRIIGVAFGAEDFTHDLGIERSEDETPLLFARSSICTAALAAGILPLETPYFRFRDEDGLRLSSRAARNLGFKGRFAIHPAQVEPINDCFSPSQEQLIEAQRIVDAFEKAERAGRGSTSLDGVVIDVPVVRRARAVLDLAQRLS